MNTICDYVGWGGEKNTLFSSWKPQIEEKGPKSHASLATHPFEGVLATSQPFNLVSTKIFHTYKV
jgi:hypothetical protein